jgi:hypothetical protein
MERIGWDADWEHAEAAGLVLTRAMGQLTATLMNMTASPWAQEPPNPRT